MLSAYFLFYFILFFPFKFTSFIAAVKITISYNEFNFLRKSIAPGRTRKVPPEGVLISIKNFKEKL